MKKSLTATLVVGALVFGLALGSVGIAYAQTDDAASETGRVGFLQIITDVLGLTQDEFIESKQSGESIPKIAEDAGVSTDEIVDALSAQEIERLDALLADELITQEQYDWALENMADRIEERIMSDGIRGPGMRNGRGMHGQAGAAMGERGAFGPGVCQPSFDATTDAPEA